MTVALEHIVVRRGNRAIVDDVSASWGRGAYGVLGTNGAGKSTLLKVIAGLIVQNSGRVSLPAAAGSAAPSIGYLPQNLPFPRSLKIQEAVEYAAWLQGFKGHSGDVAKEVLTRLDLDSIGSTKLGAASGGMQRRTAIACAMVGRPRVLLLDEPTTGVDVAHREGVLAAARWAADQCTVLLTSHLSDDIDALCAGVLVLDEGRVTFEGTRNDATAQAGTATFREAIDALLLGTIAESK